MRSLVKLHRKKAGFPEGEACGDALDHAENDWNAGNTAELCPCDGVMLPAHPTFSVNATYVLHVRSRAPFPLRFVSGEEFGDEGCSAIRFAYFLWPTIACCCEPRITSVKP